jgi:hypothetical protein
MGKLDDTTREIIEKDISNAKMLQKSLATDSMSTIDGVLDTINAQLHVYSLLLGGSTAGNPDHEYYKRAVAYYEEQKFLMNWIKKGFKGIESSTLNYVAGLEKDILGVKE